MRSSLQRFLTRLSLAGLFVLFMAQAALGACDPGSGYPSGSDGSHFDGYNLTDTPPSSFAGVEASITTYDSFTTVGDSLWVMAVNDNCPTMGKCYAQTGYADGQYGISTPVIWVEVSNTNGYWAVLKNSNYPSGWCNYMTDTTCRSGQAPGAGSHSYMIHQKSSNSQRFFAEFDSTLWFENTADLGWSTVTRYTASAEVHSQRDQSPGGINSKVTFNNIHVDNNGWTPGHLDSVAASPSYSWQVMVTTAPSFQVWDSRCSN